METISKEKLSKICERTKKGIRLLPDIDELCKRYVDIVRTNQTNQLERCEIMSSLTVFAEKHPDYAGGLRMKTDFMDAVQTDLREASTATGRKVWRVAEGQRKVGDQGMQGVNELGERNEKSCAEKKIFF